jgi:tryptophan synthase alpha subunit
MPRARVDSFVVVESSVALGSRLSHLTVDRRIRRIDFVTPTTNALILLPLSTARRLYTSVISSSSSPRFGASREHRSASTLAHQ